MTLVNQNVSVDWSLPYLLIGIKNTNIDKPEKEAIKLFNEKYAPSLARRVAETFKKLGHESGVRYESNLICK